MLTASLWLVQHSYCLVGRPIESSPRRITVALALQFFTRHCALWPQSKTSIVFVSLLNLAVSR